MRTNLIALATAACHDGPTADDLWHLFQALADELDDAGSVHGLAEMLHERGDLTGLEVANGLHKAMHLFSSTLYAELLAVREHR